MFNTFQEIKIKLNLLGEKLNKCEGSNIKFTQWLINQKNAHMDLQIRTKKASLKMNSQQQKRKVLQAVINIQQDSVVPYTMPLKYFL